MQFLVCTQGVLDGGEGTFGLPVPKGDDAVGVGDQLLVALDGSGTAVAVVLRQKLGERNLVLLGILARAAINTSSAAGNDFGQLVREILLQVWDIQQAGTNHSDFHTITP